MLKNIRQLTTGILNIGVATLVTLDTNGDFTISNSYMKVVPFGGVGATDDGIRNINGGNEGDVIVLRAATTASDSIDQITVTDTGNIVLAGAADFVMDTVNDTITLIYDGSSWLELSRSGN